MLPSIWRRMSSSIQSRVRPNVASGNLMRSRPRAARIYLEELEDRTLLSNIVWFNRGSAGSDSDNFNAYYGANADRARAIVDQAIHDWETVIDNFNYQHVGEPDNPSVANTFTLGVTATDLPYEQIGSTDEPNLD